MGVFLGAFPGYLEYHFDGVQFFLKDVSSFTFVVNVLHACMHVYQRHAWLLGKSEEAIGSPGTGIQDGFELPGRCWELSLHCL